MPPMPSDQGRDMQESPAKKTRLSLKMLHELILELHQEKRELVERVETLEYQLAEERAKREETAAAAGWPAFARIGEYPRPKTDGRLAADRPVWSDTEEEADFRHPEWACVPAPQLRTGETGHEWRLSLPKPDLPPRSKRRPAPKKPFWSRLFIRFRARKTAGDAYQG